MSNIQVNNIPSATTAPDIWTRDVQELDYDISHQIETVYSGGFRYWAGVGFLLGMLLVVIET